MKNITAITVLALTIFCSLSTFAQEDKDKLSDFERYKLRQRQNLEEFVQNREAHLKRLEQDYKNYLKGLSSLQAEYEKNDEPEKAEMVKDMIEYEKTIRKNTNHELTDEDFEDDSEKDKAKIQPAKVKTAKSEEKGKPKVEKQKKVEKPNASKSSKEKPEKQEPETIIENVEELTPKNDADPYTPNLVPLPESASRITSPFGTRMHPVLKREMKHNGVDFGSPMNTKTYAAANGRVTVAQYSKSFGNFIMIEHENGYVTVYAHLESMSVKPGDVVKKGDEIALSGNTGRSTGPHLHYEIRLDGTPIDPDDYLTQQL